MGLFKLDLLSVLALITIIGVIVTMNVASGTSNKLTPAQQADQLKVSVYSMSQGMISAKQ